MMGATNPLKALPGTIRGSYGIDIGRNVIHGSDSPESAQREIALFFKEDELIDYSREVDCWIYE
jgi:nucleoside-diphosphate kinase